MTLVTGSSMVRRLRTIVGEARCRYFDWRHDVQTCGDVALADLEVSGDTVDHAVYYAPSHPKFLFQMLRDLDIDYSAYEFVDLGSGKGRALLVASEFPFKRITGVEFARALHEIATENIRRYTGGARRCHAIVSVHGDAIQHRFSDSPAVVFMFNPFRPAVLTPVLRTLEASIQSHPRDVILLYASPFHGHIVEQETSLRLVSEQPYHNVYRRPFNA
jgi:SAM-dependent methyltransferase